MVEIAAAWWLTAIKTRTNESQIKCVGAASFWYITGVCIAESGGVGYLVHVGGNDGEMVIIVIGGHVSIVCIIGIICLGIKTLDH